MVQTVAPRDREATGQSNVEFLPRLRHIHLHPLYVRVVVTVACRGLLPLPMVPHVYDSGDSSVLGFSWSQKIQLLRVEKLWYGFEKGTAIHRGHVSKNGGEKQQPDSHYHTERVLVECRVVGTAKWQRCRRRRNNIIIISRVQEQQSECATQNE